MKKSIITKSSALLLAIAISISALSFLFSEDVSAADKNLPGTMYVFKEKDAFDLKNSRDTFKTSDFDADARPIGKLFYSGTVDEIKTKDGSNAFLVKEGNMSLRYEFNSSYRLNDYNEDDWHLYMKDNAKKVNGVSLDGKNKSGAIIVQSSFDGKTWCTDEILTDAFAKDKETTTDIYTTNEIQLISGCYYRVIVAYKMEKTYDSYKIKNVEIKDKKTYRRIEEVYVFFAEGNNTENYTNATKHPNQSPYTYYDFKKTDANYTEKGTLTDSDPNYGERIGQFEVRGFTSKIKGDDGKMVFCKTGDDLIAVSFNLFEKDLNNLFDSNKKYKLNYDKDAKDLGLQIKQTHFKKGLLVIDYVDDNNVSVRMTYTNFLAACATTKANTGIFLFEEGSYKITLDYEILEVNKLKDKTYNYQIVFEFEVKNDNSMFFVFDSLTNNELKDQGSTPNGITINLAASKNLRLTYKWYKYKYDNGKVIEDQAQNQAANDLQSFTSPGRYEITTITETGNETTKSFYITGDKYTDAVSIYGLEEVNRKLGLGYEINDDGTMTD